MKSYYDCNTPEKLLEYTELVEKALDTKLFKILAHPDIYMLGYPDFDSLNEICVNRILDAAERNGEVVPCDDLPKAFVLTSEYGFNRVRLTSLSSATLEKRLK